MSVVDHKQDPFVIMYSVPWSVYERILDALGEYHVRHTYDHGTLEMRGLLNGVNWLDYIAFLEALGDYSLRHTYDRGTLEMMSPRKDHDWVKRFVGRIVEAVSFAFNINIQSIGSTTLTGKMVERGFQPDEAYYVANEPLVRGKSTYVPDVDPPPDLLVEVDVTSSSLPRMPSFAALGLPEVWRHEAKQIHFFRLTDTSDYQEIDHSVAFPFLTAADVNGCLGQMNHVSENQALRTLIDTLQERRAASDDVTT